MKTVLSFHLIAILLLGCNAKNSESDKIIGTYVREFTFEVKHGETGNVIGMGTIRDTIFIKRKQDGFEISNNKWRLNDYDNEGWRNQEHAEDRSRPIYLSTYDPTDNTLNSNPYGLMPTLHLDIKNRNLYVGKNTSKIYKKLN